MAHFGCCIPQPSERLPSRFYEAKTRTTAKPAESEHGRSARGRSAPPLGGGGPRGAGPQPRRREPSAQERRSLGSRVSYARIISACDTLPPSSCENANPSVHTRGKGVTHKIDEGAGHFSIKIANENKSMNWCNAERIVSKSNR